MLLAHDPKIDARNAQGETPLLNAAAAGNLEIAHLLLKRGAKPDVPGPVGLSPLLFVAFGHPEMVDLLLQNGADLDQTDDRGNTALLWAAGPYHAQWEIGDGASNILETPGGDPKIVARLLTAGADIDHRNDDGFTAWSLADSAGCDRVAALLTDRGAKPVGTRLDPSQAFRSALAFRRFDRADRLLARGAEIDHRNERGSTPLMQAAYDGRMETVRYLLERAADPTIRNHEGYSALDFAIHQNRPKIQELLVEAGGE